MFLSSQNLIFFFSNLFICNQMISGNYFLCYLDAITCGRCNSAGIASPFTSRINSSHLAFHRFISKNSYWRRAPGLHRSYHSVIPVIAFYLLCKKRNCFPYCVSSEFRKGVYDHRSISSVLQKFLHSGFRRLVIASSVLKTQPSHIFSEIPHLPAHHLNRSLRS